METIESIIEEFIDSKVTPVLVAEAPYLTIESPIESVSGSTNTATVQTSAATGWIDIDTTGRVSTMPW